MSGGVDFKRGPCGQWRILRQVREIYQHSIRIRQPKTLTGFPLRRIHEPSAVLRHEQDVADFDFV